MTVDNSITSARQAHRRGLTKLMLATASAALLLGGCAGSGVEERTEIARAATASDSQSSLLTLADRMADQGDFAAAIPLYRQAYADGDDDSAALAGLARSLIGLGRYPEAEEILLLAVEEDEDDAEVHLGLGETNLAFGQPELALEHYETAVSLNPSARAFSGRGVALDALGRHTAAMESHERAVRAAPNDVNVLSNKALSHALYGEPQEAVAILEDVVARPDAQVQHRQNLVLAYVFAGDEAKARRMAAVDLDPTLTNETIAYFREIASLEPQQRVGALLFGAQEPERDLDDSGVLVFEETDDKDRAAERIVREPEPEPAPLPPPEPELEPEPEPEPEPAPTDLPPLVDPEGWSVQVGAYRRAEKLVEGQQILWERFDEILGGVEPRRSEVDFGDRETPPRGFFYRLNAGPLKDFEEARSICERLQAASAPCWIRPPEPTEGRLPGSSRD